MMTENYSTFSIARMLQVDPGSVANWIDQGRLKAHRTPGGHRRVGEQDLREFLQAHQMPLPPQLQAAHRRVLIVDSEPAVVEMVRQTIQKELPDCEVMEARDSFRAGVYLASFKPSLVILDTKMPGLDAADICRLIKSQPETSHVKILAISPQSTGQKNVSQLGATAYLSTPLNPSALVKELQSLL